MLLFRSEEHLETWLEDPAHPRGETLSLPVQWELAQAWFTGRADQGWQRRSAAEAEAVFRSAGLTSDFWRLA